MKIFKFIQISITLFWLIQLHDRLMILGDTGECFSNEFTYSNTFALAIIDNQLFQYTFDHRIGLFPVTVEKENFIKVNQKGNVSTLLNLWKWIGLKKFYDKLIAADTKSYSVAFNQSDSLHLLYAFLKGGSYEFYVITPAEREVTLTKKNPELTMEDVVKCIIISSPKFENIQYQPIMFAKRNEWQVGYLKKWRVEFRRRLICYVNANDQTKVYLTLKNFCKPGTSFNNVMDTLQTAFLLNDNIYLVSFSHNLVHIVNHKLLSTMDKNIPYDITQMPLNEFLNCPNAHTNSPMNITELSDSIAGLKWWYWLLLIGAIGFIFIGICFAIFCYVYLAFKGKKRKKNKPKQKRKLSTLSSTTSFF